jgi:hypothetical protein
MKNKLKKLHAQKIFWRGNNKNALCWAFYCVNDNKKINVANFQTMHYILCQKNPILNVNPKNQAKKRLIIFNTTNGITTLRKHVNLHHSNILTKFEKNFNCPLKEDKKQLLKKGPNIFFNSIFSCFFAKEHFKNDDM